MKRDEMNRDQLIEGLKVAMLGTTDGDFIDGDTPIPAGEMFRIAGEWVESVLAARAVSLPDRDKLTEAIRSVTDLWDEPLDEVHDVPQIVNAVLAALSTQPAAGEVETRSHSCNPRCPEHCDSGGKTYRRTVTPWIEVQS